MTARLGLGTAALGRPEYLNLHQDLDRELGEARYDRARLERHAHEVLDAAWAAGVRHVDTARSYGAGEEFVGSWLAAAPRPGVTVGSKWGYTYVAGFEPGAAEHEVKDHTLATFERQWRETRAALGRAPDLYLVHSLTSDSPALDDPGVLDALRGLAATGVRVGLSTSGPDQATVLRRALALHETPFSTVQSTWNLLEPSVGPTLAEAHAAGWSVVVKEALANGRLAERDAEALAAALAQPWADVVLSGASSVSQLHANLAALEVTEPPEPTPEDPAAYWAHRRTLRWE